MFLSNVLLIQVEAIFYNFIKFVKCKIYAQKDFIKI